MVKLCSKYLKRTQYEMSALSGDMSIIRTATVRVDENTLIIDHSRDDWTGMS